MKTLASLPTRTDSIRLTSRRSSRSSSRRSGLAFAILVALTSAQAQSVQVGGDINPFPATNPQSAWNLGAAELTVGNTGTGSLVIADGGSVFGDGSADALDFLKVSAIGRTNSSSGEATVTGANSLWAMSHSLYVGHAGTGSLAVENGGSVTSGIDGVIGFASGSHGTATVTGADSSWTAAYGIYVGVQGTGSLTVANGGRVINGQGAVGDGYIGYSNGSRGTVTVTGAGSSWSSGGDLILGGDSLDYAATNASATLNVAKSGAVEVGGTLKVHAGGTLAVEVSGPDASVTTGGDLSNDGLVRISAAPRLAAGTYTPLAVTGEFTGTGRYQALGGTWNASTRQFTVTEAVAAVSGEEAILNLTEAQRLTVTGEKGMVSAAFSADGTAAGGGSIISVTATENHVTEIAGNTVLTAWDFLSNLGPSGVDASVAITMEFKSDTVNEGDVVTVWHSFDGGIFQLGDPVTIMLTGEWAGGGGLDRRSEISDWYNVTFAVEKFGTYAITLAPIPEPASVAVLTGLGALGLVALRRKRRSA